MLPKILENLWNTEKQQKFTEKVFAKIREICQYEKVLMKKWEQ